jgi:arsenite/tail-anchored protein-transporting ATPase
VCNGVQDSVVMVKELFRNKEATEFVVATIPTMLAVNESERLLRSLRKDNIPCKRIVVNQVCVSLLPSSC